jgi:hypothetical protein
MKLTKKEKRILVIVESAIEVINMNTDYFSERNKVMLNKLDDSQKIVMVRQSLNKVIEVLEED